ncbi:5-methyltetrahydrofolate--homocysteine methyltransferase, partial [Candidatus Nitromaritima sp. SCGC AAA799-A02]
RPYMRKVLTSVFLEEARRAGLDCAILNPNHYVPLESLPARDVELAHRVILERDMNAFDELEQIALTKESICAKIKDGFKQKEEGTVEKEGAGFAYRDRIVLEAAEAVERHDPLDFIGDYLMKTMRELGDAFGRGEVSLPHLLKSADVMRNVMEFLEWYMRAKSGVQPGEAIRYKGVVVIGTVYQDVHSIGKDLAKTLLENYGYRVVDLGVQVPLENFIQTAKKENADAIGMSALLVQTSNHMITVARMLIEQSCDIPILIGGAPVNSRHAGYVAMHGQGDTENILNNIFYCESGMDGVNVMNQLKEEKGLDDLLRDNQERLLREYQRAKGIKDKQDELLATLPRRVVEFKKHEVLRDGYGLHKVEFRLHKLASNLDNKSLFSLNWKFGKKSTWKAKAVDLDQLKKLKEEWIEKAEENGWIVPKARFILMPAQSDGDEVILYHPEDTEKELGRIRFSVCVGKGQKDLFSVAQYFYSKSSGRMDAIGLQITTAGNKSEKAIADFKKANDLESALYLQGLCDRVAEDLAEYIHHLIGMVAGHKIEKQGQRYSPGYAALADLSHNRLIWEILKAEDLGIALTDADEFDPPSTTAAVICFHRDAGYT